MKDYGRKTYLAKNYKELMTRSSNAAIWNQIKQRHSEHEKPYRAKSYAKMQHYFPNLPSMTPSDRRFDHPWMGRPVDDAKKIAETVYLGFLGCGFEFPGLFPSVAKCETRCVYLDNWHMHSKTPGGPLVPDDPIVSWEAKNGVITESDMFHACIKADADAPYGQWVELIATTKSGATCRGFAWVEGDECCSYDLAYDYGTSAATVARNDSCTVAITGSDGPFNWSVSGTGFTLDNATTTGLTNTLNADGTACGSATITVTDTCSGSATGYVRCTTGQWVDNGAGCTVPGPYTSKDTGGGSSAIYKRLLGKDWVWQTIKVAYATGDSGDCPSYCNYDTCTGCNDCVTGKACAEIRADLIDCGADWWCGEDANCGAGASGVVCLCNASLVGYEWEC